MTQSTPTCWFLIGPPNSGKSTWVKKNAPDAVIISSDQYIERRAEELGKTYGEVFKDSIGPATAEMMSTLDNAIISRLPLVWDQTNLTKKSRKAKLDKLKKYNVIAVAFEIPYEEILRRRNKRKNETGKDVPDHILQSMFNTYQRPSTDEGFSKIIIVN
jgi:predicted kinase